MEVNPGGPGRPPGSKDSFPRNSYRAMKEMIAGRTLKTLKDEEGKDVQKSPAEIMAEEREAGAAFPNGGVRTA